jgi:ArsR family transcriptional regulator, zinc-responsive transcriptional repressor
MVQKGLVPTDTVEDSSEKDTGHGDVATASRTQPGGTDALTRAVDLLKALASPVRLAVIVELGTAPRCVHELSDALRDGGREVSQPLMSQHLRVLRDAGLVTTTRRATEVTYQLADSHIGDIVDNAIRHSQEERP